MKKYIAEMIGTMVLVLFGCGSAVFNGGCGTPSQVLTVAFAFGLSVVAMAYAIGGVSGCHINPAITLGCLLTGRISTKDAAFYWLFQVIGAIIGSAILYAIVQNISPADASYITADGSFATTTGANACQPGVSTLGALIAEVVGTFVFVLVVLGVTDSKKGNSLLAGLAIGLSLTLIHIVLIPLTGTSVNPARSIGPALFNGGEPLSQLWIFIVAPLVGAALSALVWKIIGSECCTCYKQE